MTKIASMKVQVTADTSRFDSSMARVRGELRRTREGVGAAGAAMGGMGQAGSMLGGALGFAALSGPLMAFSAAGTAIAVALQRFTSAIEQDEKRGQEGLAEIVQGRMAPTEVARLTSVAKVIDEEATAGDVKVLLDSFGTTDREQRRKFRKAGLTDAQIASTQEGDVSDRLRAIRDISASPIGDEVALALGKQAELFNKLLNVRPELLEKADRPSQTQDLIVKAQAAELQRQQEAASTPAFEQSNLSYAWEMFLLGLEQMFTPDEDLFAARDRELKIAENQLRALEALAGNGTI